MGAATPARARGLEIPMVGADEAVISTIEPVMLDPSVVEEIITRTLHELQVDTTDARPAALEQERADLDEQLAHLTDAIAAGRDLATLLSGVRSREARREELQRAISALGKPVGRMTDARTLRAMIDVRVRDWRGLLRKHVEQGQ